MILCYEDFIGLSPEAQWAFGESPIMFLTQKGFKKPKERKLQ
jgi:hypothetical protein